MENQATKSSVVSRLWGNWVRLDPQQRQAVAQNLGSVGQVLTIAANVHQFVASSQVPTPQTKPETDEDSDIIDVEFAEVTDP